MFLTRSDLLKRGFIGGYENFARGYTCVINGTSGYKYWSGRADECLPSHGSRVEYIELLPMLAELLNLCYIRYRGTTQRENVQSEIRRGGGRGEGGVLICGLP